MSLRNWSAEDKQLFKELMGEVCRCGARKGTGKSHCKDCYFKLPRDLRTKLYRRIGDGYAEAYNESAKFLDGPDLPDEQLDRAW